MSLKDFFCNLLGCQTPCPDCPDCPDPQEPVRSVELNRTTLRDFNGPVGSMREKAIGVQAIYSDDGSPAAGISLQVTVAKGPARLPDDQSTISVVTGPDGHIAVDARMESAGWSLYEVALEGEPQKSLFFGSCTNEMTQRIYLYTDPCPAAVQGKIEVEISAIDFDGNPVTGANLVLEASNEALYDMGLTGEVQEVGAGRYRGTIENKKAGEIVLLVQDRDSFAIGRSAITVLPGPPDHIAILGETDPRAAEPYDQIDLHVQLQDAQGNPLPPTALQATAEANHPVVRVLEGPTAIFRVNAVGYQYLPIQIAHPESGLSESITLHFAATWLRDPGYVVVKSTFATSLFVTPRPDTSTDHGTVTIKFDPGLADFKDFVPATGEFDYQYAHELTNSTLVLKFQSEQTYNANDYPNGMYLGDIVWECVAEGETCFSLSGQMSPTTDPWDLCLQQKKDRKDCICINIIYPTGNNASKNAGTAAANQVKSIIASDANVAVCCPVLEVEVHYCAIPQATINGIVGADGTVNTSAEWTAMAQNATCMKANCINLKMIPVAIPVPGGTSKGRTYIGPPGTGILDPATIGTAANVGAHEIGHSLGLNHASAGGSAANLMHTTIPIGDKLNKAQCKTIFQTIGSYAC